MKKSFFSLLLALCLTFSTLVACGGSGGDDNSAPAHSSNSSVEESSEEASSEEASSEESSSSEAELVDYASQLKLDMNSTSKKITVTVKNFIDGDTTHFFAAGFPDGVLKARYQAVNTPESTGKLEEWGKKAAKFTRSKLETATSILIESEGTEWETDSTGDRYLSWVWYKAPGATEYRNLNLELLQEGLALGAKASTTRYGELCSLAISQASANKLFVYSKDKDPDFFYGDAYEIDLKELRLNIEYYAGKTIDENGTVQYLGKRVAFEGTVASYANQGVYVENYDAETDMYYGMYVYYGFFLNADGQEVLNIGNRVRIVGNVQYYEAGDSYQVSDLKYSPYRPNDPDSIKQLETGLSAAYPEVTAAQFTQQYTMDVVEPETEEPTKKTFTYAQLALNSSISMKNLYVQRAYTTQQGNNKGAITLTCTSGGKTITVRTVVLKDASGNVVTQDMFVGKTIDVKGLIDVFDGTPQIKVLTLNSITIH